MDLTCCLVLAQSPGTQNSKYSTCRLRLAEVHSPDAGKFTELCHAGPRDCQLGAGAHGAKKCHCEEVMMEITKVMIDVQRPPVTADWAVPSSCHVLHSG